MAKVKNEIILEVKGSSWKFEALTDREFNRKHKEHKHAVAITEFVPEKVVSFRIDNFNFETILHELGHVLIIESNNHSTDLSVEQMEELCCSLTAGNYFLLGSLAEKIIGALK